jgi:hypothetical protein
VPVPERAPTSWVVEHGAKADGQVAGTPAAGVPSSCPVCLRGSERIFARRDHFRLLTSTPNMSTQDRAPEAPKTQETTSTPSPPTNQKGGKPKRTKEAEEKVPITFSVSADFARKLKIVISAMDESSGEYVESRLSGILKKDLKRILEEMA